MSINATMQAAVLEKPLSIHVKEIPVPTPAADEALVQVYCIGICGSDIHYYEHGRIGRYVVEKPIILGHELAGRVVAVGSAVSHLRVGDRVAVEPGVPCNRCQQCRAGRYNLCPDVVFLATPPVDGAWAEYIAIRADFLHILPDGMSYETGALLEPLSVGFHAMSRAGIGPKDTVLVSGLGPVGMLAAVAARMFGAATLIGSDVIPLRREMAERFAVDATFNPLTEDGRQRIAELTGGVGVTAVVETSGNARAVANAIDMVNFGGKIAVIGLPASNQIAIDVPTLVDKELDIFGVFRYANTYPAAIRVLQSGRYDVEQIITQRFPLTDIAAACEVARLNKDESVKVMIYPNRGGFSA